MCKNNNIIKEFRENNISYYLIQTPYGVCKQQKANYNNSVVGIQSALNKSDYFRNMCYKKFGNNNDDLSQINYINNKTKIKILDSNKEEYWIEAGAYLKGKRKAKNLISDTYFKAIISLYKDIIILNMKYINKSLFYTIKTKYGLCKVSARSLYKKRKISIVNAINKTEYFINQAKEIHGNKYDYSKVNYINNCTNVIIINPKYNNEFLQQPNNHLQGRGCPIEAKEKIITYNIKNPVGWKYSIWEKASKTSKVFTGYKVYFIKCWDKETKEVFYKIGRTFTDINIRFKSKHCLPYEYEVLKIIMLDDALEICKLEKHFKDLNNEYKYIPKKHFAGKQECYYEINM